VAREQVVGQFQANFAPAVVAVTLPCAVEGGLIIQHGLGLIALARGQLGELQVNHAVARSGFPEGIEVGRCFGGSARVGERGGQLNFGFGVRDVGQRGAKGVNGFFGTARAESLLAADFPSLTQFDAVILKRAVKQQGERENDDGEEEKSEQRKRISQNEIAPGYSFFRCEHGARVEGRHRCVISIIAGFRHLYPLLVGCLKFPIDQAGS
jgi:hypothetical protein